MTWRLPGTYHSAGHGRGTATLKFYEGRDILHLPVVVADLHTLITPRINHRFSLTLAGAVAHLA